ncbi:hypothetical protein Nepgr_017096 [Nepenthes gracilis]|uniref:Uncharacterized protein n=1 Tax=Nepenthes gracilis TaxID=150966 RepID=A0AAD3XT31_NEPGR|nr:hypothetical protein Nepgr_017096 [Nepenthes gracilis]
MANSQEESKSDGLEIVSIGALYSGHWDKKYWSSSRGKDRYPYPVGYEALRTHNGISYKMEIHEGTKGPIFQITSSDSQSCSGQTPDIALENIQKKGFSRIKLWHGKRFSCKIDGVEVDLSCLFDSEVQFFGFRNALVQRLLREMVANVNGAEDGILLLTNFCKGASFKKGDNLRPELCTYPDLMPYLAKPQITRKRSRKSKSVKMRLTCGATCKRNQPQLLAKIDFSGSKQNKQRSENDANPMTFPTSDEECGICDDDGTLPVHMKFEPGKDFSSQVNVLSYTSDKVSDNPEVKSCLAQEESKLDCGRSMSASPVHVNFLEDEKPLDRLQNIEVQRHNSSTTNEDKYEEVPAVLESLHVNPLVLEDSEANNFVHLCAPDTCDSLQENANFADTRCKMDEPCNERAELAAALVPSSNGLISGSHPKEEPASCNSNDSPEQNDFDSVGEEIAKSMMTVLLPQALPLLKFSSRKKKKRRNDVLKDSPFHRKPENEHNRSRPSVDAASAAGMLSIISTLAGQTAPNSGLGSAASCLENSFALDSFENDQNEEPIVNRVSLALDIETVESNLGKEMLSHDGKEYFLGVDANQYEANDNGKLFCLEELPDASGVWLQNNDVPTLVSALDCTCPGQNTHTRRSEGNCLNSNNSSILLESQSKKEEFDAVPDFVEGRIECNASSAQISEKEGVIEAGKDGACNAPLIPSPAFVSSIRHHNAPLSESIIFQNMIDGCALRTNHDIDILCAPGSCQVSMSSDNLDIGVSGCVGARFGDQLDSLYDEKSRETMIYNSTCLVSQDQALVPASGKNMSELFADSALRLERHPTYVGNDVTRHQNAAVSHEFEKQWMSFCDDHCNDKEVQRSTQVRPHMKVELNNKVEGISKLVGCYSHPIQISSVTLTRKVHEIYVCVSCGVLEERERNLFVYKIQITEPSQGCPSFIGHTSVSLPVLKDTFGRLIAVDKFGIEFTPNAQGLVLLDGIKAPYCRECKYDCLCSSCASHCFEECAVKIVQVNLGFVSVIMKLKTFHPVQCILVCEPDQLIAVDVSGRMYLWVMNPTWSAQTEEYVLPSYEFVASCVVELKRIPKSTALVLGHNGYGDFSLWDIKKRTVLSSFSAPVDSVLQFLPVSLLSCQIKDMVNDKLDEEFMTKLMAATTSWLSEHKGKNAFSHGEGDDIAVWLLICTTPESLDQPKNQSTECQMNRAGCWKLGLLIKNTVILGTQLDPRTVAIGNLAGHGIIGTHEGLVYMWELSTGTVVGALHNFEGSGGGVSDIATDDSEPAAMAIAGENGQLWIYLHC